MRHTGTYVISILLLLFCLTTKAQTETTLKTVDTTKQVKPYSLRIGTDISKLVKSAIDEDYQGFELNADFRVAKRWFIAAEFGKEDKTTTTDFINATSSGSYFKAGLDYNMYQNWLDMQNMIYSGFRVGYSNFSQTRNSYTVYAQDQFWTPQSTNTTPQEASGLSATWLELILGIKAEVLKNLFLGINVQLKGTLSQKEPDNFENLYIPGFNKTYDDSRFGVGYGYTVSYRIPLFNK